jgi:hypothetical protein
MAVYKSSGGNFSIGGAVWPGVSKVIEEMGELQQVLGKLIATGGDIKHWDGFDLRTRLIEEIGDLYAALSFFMRHNLTPEDRLKIAERAQQKAALFEQWHKDQGAPGTRSG